jgi:mitochondrial distribution and morphology protein 31
MSANFGQKLPTNFWRSGSQFLFRDLRTTHKISPWNTRSSGEIFRGFFARAYYGRIPSGSTRQITRRFASGGLLVLGASPHSASTVETGATCGISPEKIIRHRTSSSRILRSLTNNVWDRNFHTPQTERSRAEVTKGGDSARNDGVPTKAVPPSDANQVDAKDPKPELDTVRTNSTDALPNKPQFHRPTKDELLAAATGFWSRLRVRFKWFSIRSVRPFNIDEITTLFSWVFLGHIIWVILAYIRNKYCFCSRFDCLSRLSHLSHANCSRVIGSADRKLFNEVLRRESRI